MCTLTASSDEWQVLVSQTTTVCSTTCSGKQNAAKHHNIGDRNLPVTGEHPSQRPVTQNAERVSMTDALHVLSSTLYCSLYYCFSNCTICKYSNLAVKIYRYPQETSLLVYCVLFCFVISISQTKCAWTRDSLPRQQTTDGKYA